MAELSTSVLRRLAATQKAADHPEPGLLSAFAEGALATGEREGVLAHLAACPDWLEVLALTMTAVAEPDEVATVRAAPSFGGWLMGRKALEATACTCLVVAWVVLLLIIPSLQPDRAAPFKPAAVS